MVETPAHLTKIRLNSRQVGDVNVMAIRRKDIPTLIDEVQPCANNGRNLVAIRSIPWIETFVMMPAVPLI